MKPCSYCESKDGQISNDIFVHKTCFYKWIKSSNDNVCYLCRSPYVINYKKNLNIERINNSEDLSVSVSIFKFLQLLIAFICWYYFFGVFGYVIIIMFNKSEFNLSYLLSLTGLGLHFAYALLFSSFIGFISFIITLIY